jgi:four helix bundle protein
MRDEARADELENRLIEFAVRIITVADALPRSPAGRHIAVQLLRAGTSPAPNYAEARGAESRADFVHKLKIAVKELNESRVWLRMISKGELVKSSLAELIDENDQLSRILNASVTTARENKRRANSQMTNSQPPTTNHQSPIDNSQ